MLDGSRDADELTSPSLALLREPMARRNWQEDHRSSESFGESQCLKKEIPTAYQRHLHDRHRSILKEGGQARSLTFRGFWVGTFLSFFLAIGAPYGNMASGLLSTTSPAKWVTTSSGYERRGGRLEDAPIYHAASADLHI